MGTKEGQSLGTKEGQSLGTRGGPEFGNEKNLPAAEISATKVAITSAVFYCLNLCGLYPELLNGYFEIVMLSLYRVL